MTPDWEVEAPAEPEEAIATRRNARPARFGGPSFGRAKLPLSRQGARGSDGASPSQVRPPRYREGEAPAEPAEALAARTEPRPPKFGRPGIVRASLLLSRQGARGSDGASPSHNSINVFRLNGRCPRHACTPASRARPGSLLSGSLTGARGEELDEEIANPGANDDAVPGILVVCLLIGIIDLRAERYEARRLRVSASEPPVHRRSSS